VDGRDVEQIDNPHHPRNIIMFGAFVRRSLIRTIISSKNFTFGGSSLNEMARKMLCLRTTTITSPPPLYPSSLMVGSIREKACLSKNKSAAKRFIVRGGGRIKRWGTACRRFEVCVSVRAYCVCVENHSVFTLLSQPFICKVHSIKLLWTTTNTETIHYFLPNFNKYNWNNTRSSTKILYTPEAKAVEVTTLDIREGSVLISLQHLRMYWGLKQLKIEWEYSSEHDFITWKRVQLGGEGVEESDIQLPKEMQMCYCWS